MHWLAYKEKLRLSKWLPLEKPAYCLLEKFKTEEVVMTIWITNDRNDFSIFKLSYSAKFFKIQLCKYTIIAMLRGNYFLFHFCEISSWKSTDPTNIFNQLPFNNSWSVCFGQWKLMQFRERWSLWFYNLCLSKRTFDPSSRYSLRKSNFWKYL